uniref:Secreted protein n=1 Tax=Trichuris muris TaxID=70415 RepID=A0A5S6QJB3_TRIMR
MLFALRFRARLAACSWLERRRRATASEASANNGEKQEIKIRTMEQHCKSDTASGAGTGLSQPVSIGESGRSTRPAVSTWAAAWPTDKLDKGPGSSSVGASLDASRQPVGT